MQSFHGTPNYANGLHIFLHSNRDAEQLEVGTYLGLDVLFVDIFAHAERLPALFAFPHAATLGVQVLLDALPLLLGDVVVRHQVAVDAINLADTPNDAL